MAKEQFTRKKPHVTVITTSVLARRGCSPLGIVQITQGLVVTDPKDRWLVAEMVSEFCENNPQSGVLARVQVI
jgi:hypothetical protein